MHRLAIERAFPSSNDDGGDAVADDVGDGTALAHELVDAEHHGDPDSEFRPDRSQRSRKHDEARACHAARALGREHGDAEQDRLIAPGQRNAGGLRDEQGGERDVDVRAVEIEGIAGRYHETHDRFLAAEPLKLDHERGERTFGRTRPQHEEQLALDVAKQLKDVEPAHRGYRAQHDKYEDRGRDVEQRDEAEEVAERRRTIFADGECHRAKRTDRGERHDVAEHAEQDMRHFLDEIAHRIGLAPRFQQRKAHEDRDEEDGDDEVLVGQRADQGVRNDFADEFQRRLALGLVDVGLGGREFRGAACAFLETVARLEDIGDDDPDNEGEGRHDLEIKNGATTKLADGFGVMNAGDAHHHRAEDDGGDHHLDQLDEQCAKRFERNAQFGVEPADQAARHDRHENLHVEKTVKRRLRSYRPSCRGLHRFIPVV